MVSTYFSQLCSKSKIWILFLFHCKWMMPLTSLPPTESNNSAKPLKSFILPSLCIFPWIFPLARGVTIRSFNLYRESGLQMNTGKSSCHLAIAISKVENSIFTTPGEHLITIVYVHHLHTFVILINYSGLNSIPLLCYKIPLDLNMCNCYCKVADFVESGVLGQS